MKTGKSRLTIQLPSPTELGVNLPIRPRAVEVNCHSTEWWALKSRYVPKEGEIIIYTNRAQIEKDDGTFVDVPGIKIGDGNTYVADLPFVGDDLYTALMQMIEHSSSVTPEERARWNDKITCSLDGEMLILTKD